MHAGNPPDNFKQLFTPLNQIHSYVTRSATRGAFFWQAAENKYGKRSLKHLKNSKKRYRDNLIAAY